jgi:hypothetical protein
MKATYTRILAAAIATVGFINLSLAQDGPSAAPVNDPSVTTDLGAGVSGAPTLDTTNAPRIMINQANVNFSDAQPGIINGQLMVPVREVCEQAGGTVHWLDQEKQVMIDLPNQPGVTLDTNQDWLTLINTSDQSRPLRFSGSEPDAHVVLSSNEVILVDNRAYMPFDRLAGAINGTGDWDQSGALATITTDQGSTGDDSQVPGDVPPAPDTTPTPQEDTSSGD